MTQPLQANSGHNEEIAAFGNKYLRLPVKTCLVTAEHDIAEVLKEYTAPHLQKGDIVFVSEKMVSCAQGRAIYVNEIKPSRLAKFLSRFVEPTYSEGLGLPETMQAAINETSVLRIFIAACAGAVGKLLKKRGWFYVVAGKLVSRIDGPADRTIPPFNEYIVLAALKPEAEAKRAAAVLGVPVAIVDNNRVGCTLCGASENSITENWLAEVLKDNPLGQDSQQTPCGIIRPLTNR